MSISPGFTSEQIRANVYEYLQQRHGTKGAWLAQQSLSRHVMRRWKAAVFNGDLDRGLIPRESSDMKSPGQRRAMIEHSLAGQQKSHDAEIQAMAERIESLEDSNRALGKAIGLLHAINVEKPGAAPTESKPPSS